MPCLQKVKDNWTSICHYFLKYLPDISQSEQTYKQLNGNEKYKRICQALKSSKVTMIQINFMLVIGPLFQEYKPCFQTQEPLIHMLYPECLGVLKNVLMRFLKFEVVSGKSSSTIINIDCGNLDNCKSLKDMDIGPEVCDALSKLDGGRQKGMRTFYQQVSKHLSKKLPLQESVVKHAHCLHPEIKYQDHAM